MMVDSNAKTILIVEDNQDIADLNEVTLKSMGLNVHNVGSADKALSFLESNRPDLIVLDIGLPGMSGWEFLEIIKDWCVKEGVFVVVTTAFDDPANRLIGKFQNVATYLTKPFAPSKLEEVVGNLLGTNAES